MWYSGIGASPAHAKWSVGLATAPHPLGPWKKFAANPILKDFGYVGGVVRVGGQVLALHGASDRLDGPRLQPDVAGDGRYPIRSLDSLCRQSGAPRGPGRGHGTTAAFPRPKCFTTGRCSTCSTGARRSTPSGSAPGRASATPSAATAAISKSTRQNPVAPREANPNAAAFAEVHAIYEPPFVFLYHTLRYIEPRTAADKTRFPMVENLGVQVLAISRPFQLDMPLPHLDSLGPKSVTPHGRGPPINLTGVREVSLRLTCTYGAKATGPVRIHVLPSDDGLRWQSSDAQQLDADFQPAQTIHQTFRLSGKSKYIQVLLENTDASEPVSALDAVATLGG